MTRERTQEEIAWLIASGFARQRYPLTDEGVELKSKVAPMVQERNVPIEMIDILPTVENPRPELFCEFDITPEEEARVFGWNFSTAAVCDGCSHRCSFCYQSASRRIEMAPFAAIYKIAQAKRKYDRLAHYEWIRWVEYARRCRIVDLDHFDIRRFTRKAGLHETRAMTDLALGGWEAFGPKVIRLNPVPPATTPLSVRKKRLHWYAPLNLASIMYNTYTYIACDPLDYRDFRFLHLDGSPADYADVMKLMSTWIRPTILSTAGWFSDDPIARHAMQKIVKLCESDPLNFNEEKGVHRLSVSIYERHAEAGFFGYLAEIERMIREAASMEMFVSIYYDKGSDRHRVISYRMADRLIKLMEEELGIKNKIQLTPVSYRYGKAVDLDHGEDAESEMWDPDMNIDGVHIYPDGNVREKPSRFWDVHKSKDGTKEWFLRTPEGSVSEPTGLRLYKLNGGDD